MSDAQVIRYLIGVTPGVKLLTPDQGGVPLATVNDWASLTEGEGLRPAPDEWLMKVARYLLDGQIWTWIGLYRHAFQLGGKRPGGILGAGLLLRNAYVQGPAALAYLPNVAAALEDAAIIDGKFTRKIEDLHDFPWADHDASLRGGLLALDPLRDRGLDPDHTEQVYLDLSDAGEAQFSSWYVEWAQIGRPFAGFGRLLLGSSARIAENARLIPNLKTYTSHEFATAAFEWMQDPMAAPTTQGPVKNDVLAWTEDADDFVPEGSPSAGALTFPSKAVAASHGYGRDPMARDAGFDRRHDELDRLRLAHRLREAWEEGRREQGRSDQYKGVAWGAGAMAGVILCVLLVIGPGSAVTDRVVEEVLDTSPAASASPDGSTDTGSHPSEADTAGMAGAVDTARQYLDLLRARRLEEAFALRHSNAWPPRSEQFVRFLNRYPTLDGEIAPEGARRDAGGTVVIPLQVSGVFAGGGSFRLGGSIKLRQDSPSGEGERRWRVVEMDLPLEVRAATTGAAAPR